ncbi:hypothetical protein SAMD00019534_100750 [Acytostelium subglobosum LB1]|uniref:hypothetical protein n=1 Tax=Acytostelium subglobosum LB1 TaxID=1410327 RepID=UPI000644E7C1|nr:hypothetical protein SAMD00019534_100750 [Acytostelium subglobosum LB1]GAM26900.1 hypothetical protein SAMD00019534_100750 [Acytostelium subglobosum LB1]|eukprot:XP_012750168.1 hypothetical protein SAMD00019534_100750 [Acytostelium subglobosum LB1]
MTARSSIFIGDLGIADALISQGLLDELDEDLCNGMSESMALHITRPRPTPVTFNARSLLNIVKAIGYPGNSITEDILSQFIDNCFPDTYDRSESRFATEVLVQAAGFSARAMQLIQAKFNLRCSSQCLLQSIKKRCHGTMRLILEQNGKCQLDYPCNIMVFQLICDGSLSLSLLDNLNDRDKQSRDLLDCVLANENVEVLDHLVNNIIDLSSLGQPRLKRMLKFALIKDLVHYVQSFVGMLGTDCPWPDTSTLGKIVEYNAYHSLEYLLNTPTFNIMPTIQRLRTIYSIVDHGYQYGATRVIKLCNDQIAAITINHHQGHLQPFHQDYDKPKTGPCSHELERGVHAVFGDRKLGMIIIEHVRLVHKSLGVESVIKGSHLIDRHCLNDYIKYGATEWFIKAYSTSTSVSNNYNLSLLSMALTKCNIPIVDVLHPKDGMQQL